MGARKAHIDTFARPPLLLVVDRQWGVVSLDQLRGLGRSLDARDVTNAGGIPTTTVARTALDIAATEPQRLERLLAQADRLGLYDAAALDAVGPGTTATQASGR